MAICTGQKRVGKNLCVKRGGGGTEPRTVNDGKGRRDLKNRFLFGGETTERGSTERYVTGGEEQRGVASLVAELKDSKDTNRGGGGWKLGHQQKNWQNQGVTKSFMVNDRMKKESDGGHLCTVGEKYQSEKKKLKARFLEKVKRKEKAQPNRKGKPLTKRGSHSQVRGGFRNLQTVGQ